MENIVEESVKDVLLMLSGGRDSFLSACKLAENGHIVHLVTYDNGCMSQLSRVEDVALG